MPLRAVILLVCIIIFLGTTIARAEDCACPVVQCEPCQRKLILGTQIKECSKPPAVVCQKIVCENVDNFFQCIAGAPPLYIPPVDPATRYTEPRFTPGPDAEPKVNFTKLAEVFEKAPDAESAGESVEVVKARGPASAQAKPIEGIVEAAEKPWMLMLSRKGGEVWHGKKQLRKNSSFRSAVELVAKKKSQVSIRYSRDVMRMEMSKGAKLKFTVQDGVLLAQDISGDVQFTIENSQELFVVDIGDWRFGKKSGAFKVSHTGNVTTVDNNQGEGHLRRETLISQSDKIKEGETLKFQAGSDLYSSVPSQNESNKTNYVLQEAEPGEDSALESTERVPAAEAFCGAPVGQYEQCAWKCFGAGENAKSCASPAAASKCVRFTCSADGQWKLPTIVSDGECSVSKIHVGICH